MIIALVIIMTLFAAVAWSDSISREDDDNQELTKKNKMSVKINKIDDRTYTVNGKRIRKNMDGYWVEVNEELTPNEYKQFESYLRSERQTQKWN